MHDHKNIVNVSCKAKILTVMFIFNKCESMHFLFISAYLITAESALYGYNRKGN